MEASSLPYVLAILPLGRGERPWCPLNGGWVDPRPGLDILEKIKSLACLGI